MISFVQVKRDLKEKLANLPPVAPLAVVPLLLVAALYFRFRGELVAARVNGESISRLALIRELESNFGQQALDNLVTRKLIEQAAQEENIAIDSLDVSAELGNIEKTAEEQGQNLDAVLGEQGYTREDLTRDLRYQLVVEELAATEVNVSQDDVVEYWEENQALFPEGSNLADQEPKIRETLESQKINEQIQSWLTELRSNADIKYLLDF